MDGDNDDDGDDGDDDDELMSVSLVEEAGTPRGHHRPTATVPSCRTALGPQWCEWIQVIHGTMS